VSAAVTAVVVIALFLCSLTAGFLFAFAVVVMPGIRTLDDGSYLRAFQVMDGVIQGNQPFFILMWVGSIVAMLAVLVIAAGTLSGLDRVLLVGAAVLYLGGVQLPTAVVNIPLNQQVQTLRIDELDAPAAQAARRAFQSRWDRWNVVRTVVAIASVVMLLAVVAGADGPRSELPVDVGSPSQGSTS
jgi:uncharacterized membrane protein